MAVHDENLDDVISSLIDVDEDEEQEEQSSSRKGAPRTKGGIPPVGGDAAAAPSESREFSGVPVSLTERAARQIRKIRSNEDLDDNLFLRVAVEGGGCAGLNYKLGFDFRNSDDEELESEGIQIVVDPRHMIYLEGVVIDYPDGLDARGFTFDNPNASENCGCGSSFAI